MTLTLQPFPEVDFTSFVAARNRERTDHQAAGRPNRVCAAALLKAALASEKSDKNPRRVCARSSFCFRCSLFDTNSSPPARTCTARYNLVCPLVPADLGNVQCLLAVPSRNLGNLMQCGSLDELSYPQQGRQRPSGTM